MSGERTSLVRNMLRERAGPVRALRATRLAQQALAHGAAQKRSEFAPFLAVVLRARPRHVLEIGRGIGGSLYALCGAAAADATVVSVDLPRGPFGGSEHTTADLERLRGYARPGQTLHLLEADSRDEEVQREIRRLLPSVDLLFIDGDHSYEGVSGDYLSYRPLVRSGGIVAFHDILPHPGFPECEVDRFWAELAGSKRDIVSPAELNEKFGPWGGIGILRV